MRPIKLEDLIPQAASFTLRATGQTYKLRPLNLEDEAWVQATFGDRLQEIFEKVNTAEICRMVYRQLADKSGFGLQVVKVIDEDGAETSEQIGGAKLLQRMISGRKELLDVIMAYNQTRGVSRALMDELAGDLEKAESQKKSPAVLSTGERSSISSPVNTDGPSSRSESSPPEKSTSPSNASTEGEKRKSASRQRSTVAKSNCEGEKSPQAKKSSSRKSRKPRQMPLFGQPSPESARS